MLLENGSEQRCPGDRREFIARLQLERIAALVNFFSVDHSAIFPNSRVSALRSFQDGNLFLFSNPAN